MLVDNCPVNSQILLSHQSILDSVLYVLQQEQQVLKDALEQRISLLAKADSQAEDGLVTADIDNAEASCEFAKYFAALQSLE